MSEELTLPSTVRCTDCSRLQELRAVHVIAPGIHRLSDRMCFPADRLTGGNKSTGAISTVQVQVFEVCTRVPKEYVVHVDVVVPLAPVEGLIDFQMRNGSMHENPCEQCKHGGMGVEYMKTLHSQVLRVSCFLRDVMNMIKPQNVDRTEESQRARKPVLGRLRIRRLAG